MSYQSEVLADSPLLYLQLNETSGATCANSGSLGGNATANGSYIRNVASHHANLGVSVDLAGGSGDYISYPDTASLDITGNVTYECWVALDSFAGNPSLIGKGRDSGSAVGLRLRLDAVNRRIDIMQAATAVIFQTSTNVYPTGTGNWHHVAFTRATNLWSIYLDGAFVTSGSNAVTINATNKSLKAGADEYESGVFGNLNGKIDEVAVYNTALSAARLTAHYTAATAAAASTFVPRIVTVT